MSLNFRPSHGNSGQAAFYGPGRDILNTLAPFINSSLKALEIEDDDVNHYLKTYYLGEEELGEVAKSLGSFLCLTTTERDFETCLAKSGLNDCDLSALALVGSRLFIMFLKQFHEGYGEVTIQGSESPIPVRTYVEDCTNAMNNWRWLRPTLLGHVGLFFSRYIYKIKKNFCHFFMNLMSKPPKENQMNDSKQL